MLIEWQLRVRNATNSADDLVATSVRGGTNPCLSSVPKGDGTSVDPRTGASMLGSYSGEIADVPIGGMQRLVTSKLEDAAGRQQLGYRVAILEYRINGGAWVTLISGLLTGLSLVDGVSWTYTVSDPMRAQTITQLFSPSSSTLITDFLAQWPTRGCVLGGPVIGGTFDAFGLGDLGGWTMKVEQLASGGGTEYVLRPVHVYGPGAWSANGATKITDVAGPINDAVSSVQLPFSDGAADSWSTIEDSEAHAWAWQGLTLLVDGVPFKPLIKDYAPDGSYQLVSTRVESGGGFFHDGKQSDYGIKLKSDGVRTLVDGSLVRVRALTVLPTEISPLYLIAHPVDLLTQFWTVTGIPFNAAACATLKSLLGTDASFGLRITSARSLADLVATICLPFGIGLRGNDAGEIEPFDARLGRLSTDPIVVITSADVVKDTVRPFDFDPSEALKSITFRAKQFRANIVPRVTWNGWMPSFGNIVDSIAVNDVSLTVLDGDPGAVRYGDFELATEGMIHASASFYPMLRDFFVAIARRLFDRWGRGGIGAEMTFLRGGAGEGVKLGDEVMVAVSQIPNHNYRLLDNVAIPGRAMQVVHRTVVPIGYQVKLVDSGVGGQPPATIALASIAASADLPRTVAVVTITNAAALNAAAYGVRLQIAYTAGGAPAVDQYTDVQAWRAGEVPVGGVIRLPPVTAGKTIYVRARSEVAGARPTNWSAAANVTLTGVGAPTALTATPNVADGSLCDLAWTTAAGGAADWVDVWIRLAGQPFSAAARVRTLDVGSTRFTLEGLTPGTNYIASVRHRDPATQDVSAPVDVAFAAAGAAIVLTAPITPTGFTGAPRFGKSLYGRQGNYGIAVIATQNPGEIEVAEAVETAPGSGAYGAFATVGRVASVSADWTVWQSIGANDGKRRRLKARHVRDGATASAYTATVDVAPWTYVALAGFGTVPTAAVTLVAQTLQFTTLQFDGTADSSQLPLTWRYRFKTDATYNPAWIVGVGALPQILPFPKAVLRQSSVELEVTQADGKIATASYGVQGQMGGVATAASGRVTEDQARSGDGGVPVYRQTIKIQDQYTVDGTTPLVDATLGRFTAAMAGPTGIGATIIERGGNKGDGGFTSTTGDLVSTAKDSRAALLNNDFRLNTDTTDSVVDGTGSPISGGKRGQLTIDSLNRVKRSNGFDDGDYGARATNTTGLALHSSVVDSRASLLNNHFRLNTDDTTTIVDGTGSPLAGGKRGFSTIDSSNRVKRANGFDDGDFGARATNNTGLALHTSVVDSRASLLNTHFRLSVDTTDSVVDGTGSPISGGKRGQIGLNSSNNLVTAVDAAAKGSDGYPNIESRRGASKQAGHASGGVTEGYGRSGFAGVPTRDGFFVVPPIMDATGTQIIVDPLVIGALSPLRSLGSAKARALMVGNQTIPTGVPTTVTFAAASFDIGAITNPGAGTIIVPADYLGLWIVETEVAWAANAVGRRTATIAGATPQPTSVVTAVNGDITTQSCLVLANDPLGYVFSVTVTQNSGGPLLVTVILQAFHQW